MTKQMNKKATPKAKKNTNKKNPSNGGKGEKQLSVAVSYGKQIRTLQPNMKYVGSAGDGRVRVTHREYLGEVAGSVAFAATSYSLNPGLAAVFIWLSSLAQNFESYLFRKFRLCFETEKSSSTNGTVMLALDFNAADAAPGSKQALMALHNAVRSEVWHECVYNADKADLEKFGKQRFVRTGSLASNLDIKTYDVANMIVATQGCADTTSLGELYLEYDIELITPQAPQAAVSTGVQTITSTSATVNSSWFTTSTTVGPVYANVAGNTVTFAIPGVYAVTFSCGSTSGTLTGYGYSSWSGTAAIAAPLTFGPNENQSGVAISCVAVGKITVTAVGQTVVVGSTGAAGSPLSPAASLMIAPANSSF
jgi:hypothetical protein